jgi:tetratricopeptide (TPR) repeat protein
VPKVFISYSHDSPAHLDRVLELSNRLRAEGVDCRIDQYEQSPTDGWPLWCDRQVRNSDYVLIACTETYLRRFNKEEAPKTGLGVTWEGHIVTQELYNAQGHNDKFIPIVFCHEDESFVLITLQGATLYQLFQNYEQLYRRLTNQPSIPIPSLGGIRTMPPREPLPALPDLERKQTFQAPWQVPYPQNPFFTGREKTLEAIRKALEGPRHAAALSGLGGIGKTHTSIEYAYRHRALYSAVFWVRAESRNTLVADFASIAATLNLPSAAAKEQELTVAAVKQWLQTSPGWLLVLDNADDLQLAKEFLPHTSNGHTLFTTRARALGGLAERVVVDEMEPEEGGLLLLRRAKLVDHNGAFADAGEDEQSVARQISRELGGLPLALDQAGAFIEETPSSLTEYLSCYVSERARLLAERGSLGDHPSVAVTFSLAFAKVAETSAAAADLIRVCAFLSSEAIPEHIITDGSEHLGENLSSVANRGVDFANMLKEASRFSLIDRNPQSKTLKIHRLVQAIVQASMSDTDQEKWAKRVVLAVSKAFPEASFKNWETCQKLVPHAQVCAAMVDRWHFVFQEAAWLFNNAAKYIMDRGSYADAEPLLQRSLAIYGKVLGPDHPQVATSLNNLAFLYSNQGRYAEAEPLYQRSLAIWEKALEPDHPDVAMGLNNLASLYNSQGRYAEAEPLYQRSLAIWEKALEPHHPDMALGLNNLASLYSNQGRYAEAEPLHQRSLAIGEKALGPDHPDVATSLNNLALLYCDQGRYAEAEPLHQRSLAIREEAFGPDHPDVAMSLNNLALLYRRQGRYAEAEPLYQRSLAIGEKALGPDHPNVATIRSNLDKNRASLPN